MSSRESASMHVKQPFNWPILERLACLIQSMACEVRAVAFAVPSIDVTLLLEIIGICIYLWVDDSGVGSMSGQFFSLLHFGMILSRN